MKSVTIDLARDFTPSPFGRYLSDDRKRSGEVFREQFLIPAFEKGNHVTLLLDGARTIGSSWLEEVFGGLVRKSFEADFLEKHLTIETNRKDYENEIWEYIRDGKSRVSKPR